MEHLRDRRGMLDDVSVAAQRCCTYMLEPSDVKSTAHRSTMMSTAHPCNEFAPDNRDSCRADGWCLLWQHCTLLSKRFLLSAGPAMQSHCLFFSSFHWYIGTRDHGQRSTPLQLHWLLFASISKEQERSSTFH
jgi:hypothetical protein